MDTVMKAAGVGILAVLLASVLKKESPALALLVCVGAACAVLPAVLREIGQVVGAVNGMADAAGVSAAVTAAVWKTTAISAVTRFASAVCADGGQASAAAAVELAGCAAAVCAALPLMETVLEMVGVLL